MNIYKVTDDDGIYVFVAAENYRDALRGYPDDYAEHAYLIERDTDLEAGECTTEYERSRGVDLIMSGVISPNWMNAFLGSSMDDYRKWNGFVPEI